MPTACPGRITEQQIDLPGFRTSRNSFKCRICLENIVKNGFIHNGKQKYIV